MLYRLDFSSHLIVCDHLVSRDHQNAHQKTKTDTTAQKGLSWETVMGVAYSIVRQNVMGDTPRRIPASPLLFPIYIEYLVTSQVPALLLL